MPAGAPSGTLPAALARPKLPPASSLWYQTMLPAVASHRQLLAGIASCTVLCWVLYLLDSKEGHADAAMDSAGTCTPSGIALLSTKSISLISEPLKFSTKHQASKGGT